MALSPKQIMALHDKMLGKRLYVIFSDPTEKGGDRRKIFPTHIAYQLELENKGILFAAGPFVDGRGKSSGAGMIIIRAKSMAAAKRIADNDPFHKQGYRSYRIRPWIINEGGFSLRVKFSDGSYDMD